MGVFRRLFGKASKEPRVHGRKQTDQTTNLTFYRCSSGEFNCEVVGEASYQPAIRRILESSDTENADFVVVPEPTNQFDPNAVAIKSVAYDTVGYLPRAVAALVKPALVRFHAGHGGHPCCSGTIVGGSKGIYGVWLDLDFRVLSISAAERKPLRIIYADEHTVSSHRLAQGTVRTGLGEAHARDAQDDTYDLRALHDLPDSDTRAIQILRECLSKSESPVERHYIYSELEQRLYKNRLAFASAFDEFDQTCEAHEDEMARIAPALVGVFGFVPLLTTHRQSCIRHQQAKRLDKAAWWARQGLAWYGEYPESEVFRQDLRGRVEKLEKRLEKKPQAGITQS